jgi:hypothetical protein
MRLRDELLLVLVLPDALRPSQSLLQQRLQ